MIDDAVLEELLMDAAERIEVPLDGPDRVLAGRGPVRPRPQVRSWRRTDPRTAKRRPVLVAVTMGLLLAGGIAGFTDLAGSGSSTKASVTSGGLPIAGPSFAGPLNSATGSEESGSGTATPTRAGSGVGGGVSPNEVPSPQSKVIETGSVDLQVGPGQLNNVMSKLTGLASGYGGFVASSSTNSTTAGAAPFGDITLRVPVADFGNLLNQVRALGTPTSVSTNGQDVTSQYVDLQARIQSLEDARTQFEQILAKAQSISDILSVEQQIDDLQTQIEQLQGQAQVMDNQATYSTLSVHVSEPTKSSSSHSEALGGLAKAWDHARHSFAHGVDSVLGALGGIAVFLAVCMLLIGFGRLGWIVIRRRLV